MARTLRAYLTDEEAPSFTDYQRFIRTKAELIVETREAADRVAAAEEQLQSVKESL